ncbi:MAG: sulfite exporter TauE/SafE family protein [Leptospiraceae bacterium]|nr:sulfite exporter TauE/SafE family protein [Leptospiraceae bacterium]MCP5511416.1 sulfite exporter TauE/SafE family protein [Leptospiraceae bacterium]
MTIEYLALFIGTIVSFWISAISGGGASLILIPILNLLIPSSFVPFSLTIGTFTSSASRILVFKRHIKWNIFFWFVPFSIPAVLIGAYLIKYINPIYLQFFVALFLIANLPQLFFSREKQEMTEKSYPKSILALIGFLAGFVSGITGSIGLLFNRFYLKYGLTKEEIVATRAANEIFLHFFKLIIYVLLGLYSIVALKVGILVALGSIISSYTVKFILPLLNEFAFRKIGYGAMVLSGFVLLFSSSRSILKQDTFSLSGIKEIGSTSQKISWPESEFVLEFAIDAGLAIERPVHPDDLPKYLKIKYNSLLSEYDRIFIERVYRPGTEIFYEFYCYKSDQMLKMEFQVTEWDQDIHPLK